MNGYNYDMDDMRNPMMMPYNCPRCPYCGNPIMNMPMFGMPGMGYGQDNMYMNPQYNMPGMYGQNPMMPTMPGMHNMPGQMFPMMPSADYDSDLE